LEAEGKRMIQVNINNAYQVVNLSFVMNKDWQISKVYDLLNEKKGDKTKYSQDKHVLLAFQDDQMSSRAKDAVTRELIDRFGGYNAFGLDDRLIDPKTRVRNLKSTVIEIRPKIFTDKPTEKQLDMTFETKM
jgi:phage-related tail protein